MKSKDQGRDRAATDASLNTERHHTDLELARRVVIAEHDADAVLEIARQRAERLLQAARAAADARLPLSAQTESAVALLLEQRADEDRVLTTERDQADELLRRERRERRERLLAQLVLERQTTDLRLALERSTADHAVLSRDDFLAQTSHDLRGLIAAQKPYIALLVSDLSAGDDRTQSAAIAGALANIERQLDRLLNDLIDVVAMDAGKLDVALGVHSANQLLTTATSVYEPLARERGQSLTVVPGATDVNIRVDFVRGVQVLGNLLANAVKFTPPGGKIQVGYEASDDQVMFFVEDTGPGVPSEYAERIFERFVKSNPASAGLGLGLSIASGLVEAHGGRLWLDRERAPGSVFRFTLARA